MSYSLAHSSNDAILHLSPIPTIQSTSPSSPIPYTLRALKWELNTGGLVQCYLNKLLSSGPHFERAIFRTHTDQDPTQTTIFYLVMITIVRQSVEEQGGGGDSRK